MTRALTSRLARRARLSPALLPTAICIAVIGLAGCGGTHVPPAAAPTSGGPSAPPVATQPHASGGPPAPAGAASTPEVTRYCQLSDQLGELADRFPDPGMFAQQAAPLLTEITQVAPAPIREAVSVFVQDIRAAGNENGVTAPDDATVTRADSTLEAFETANCQ